jgi:predicted PurR-regulated permease PerM
LIDRPGPVVWAGRGAVLTALILAGLYFGRSVLIPVSLALLFSLLLTPGVVLIERLKIGRPASAILIVTLFFALLGWAGWILTQQVSDLARKLPEYKDNLRTKTTGMGEPLGGLLGRAYATFHELGQELATAGKAAAAPASPAAPAPSAVPVQIVQSPPSPWEVLSYTLGSIVGTLGTVALIAILVLFLLVYRTDLRDRLALLFGVTRINVTARTMSETAESVSRYLLAQCTVNAVYGALIGVSLISLGIPNALFWGVLAGVLRFVPFIGPWIGAAGPFLLALAAFPGWGPALTFLGVMAALEFTTANFVEPLFYGRRTGLSPFAVVLSIIFWTWIWGNAGLLLAVPLTVGVMALGRQVPQLRFLQTLFGKDPAVEPYERLYHRLVAMNHADAAELVEQYRKDRSALELYDGLFLPALSLAEEDRRRGQLSKEVYEDLIATLNGLLEDLDEDGPNAAAEPEPAQVHAVCLPAGSPSDEVTARLLARVVRTVGVQAEVLPASATVGEKVQHAEGSGADLIYISAVPPSSVLETRHLYKRLRRRSPHRKIVAGLWRDERGSGGLEDALASDPEVVMVRTLAEAREKTAQLVPVLVLARPQPREKAG